MLIGALGCNVAWGVIDAVLSWLACLQKWTPGPERRDEEGNQIADRFLFSSELVPLARYHLPRAFRQVESEYRGMHAFRRGLASTLFELGVSDLVVQKILRHARLIVTREHYIKRFDAPVADAMKAFAKAANKGRLRGGESHVPRLNPRKT